jgi:hypothetical protein
VEPPTAAENFQTQGKLTFRYGATTVTVDIAANIHFAGGELTPENHMVSFVAANAAELCGQERVVAFVERNPGGAVEITGAPAWLDCQVVDQAEPGFGVRMRVQEAPPGESAELTVYVGRPNEPRSRVGLTVNVFAPR